MAAVTRTMLYYPTINIPSNSWLRHSLLYWDEISSIVPQSGNNKYLYHLSPDIHYLIDEGQFRPIKPEDLIQKSENLSTFHRFQEEFKTIVQSDSFKKFVERKKEILFSKVSTEKVVSNPFYSQVHRNKTSDNLSYFLQDLGLINNKKSNGEWLMFERNTALVYMSLLAKYLAEIDKKQTTIGTDYGIYEKFNFARVKEKDGFPVVTLNLSNILPVPVSNLPLEKIVDFKRKRKDELLQFRKILMEFQIKISKAKSNQEMKEISVAFQENLKVGIKGISATLRDSKIETVFKSIKSLISLKSPTTVVSAAALANEKFNLFETSTPLKIAGLATIGLLELTGTYIDLRNKELAKTRESSFSYLFHAQKSGILKASR